MHWKQTFAIILLGVITAAAQGTSDAGRKPFKQSSTKMTHDSGKAATAASQSKPVARPKSFDLTAMDKSVNPCEDFYEYACGGWRKNNPIPPDQSGWGRFSELAEYNRQIVHDILEKASANDPKRTPILQKVGDFYATCMDEKTVNEKGAAPLKSQLDHIAAITTKDQVIETIAYLHSLGVNALFNFGAQPDLHNASMEIAGVSQGGLGLPDRDYYLAQDPKSQEIREKYQAHVAKMLVLLGDDQAVAQKEAQTVLGIETKLAQAAFERVKMRDPKNRDHKMTVADLSALAPNFQFQRFFVAAGAPSFTEVNVVPPDFFQQVNSSINEVPVEDWQAYLRWHTLRTAAPNLSEPFVQENFDFTGRFLSGQKELQARWKRCTQESDRLLGEALGQPYVQQTFGADGKQRMLRNVDALEKALAEDIQQLDWMTPETKKQAAVKLQAITSKIGYPDK